MQDSSANFGGLSSHSFGGGAFDLTSLALQHLPFSQALGKSDSLPSFDVMSRAISQETDAIAQPTKRNLGHGKQEERSLSSRKDLSTGLGVSLSATAGGKNPDVLLNGGTVWRKEAVVNNKGPLKEPGETIATARTIAVTKQARELTGEVGKFDRSDFYRFNLLASSSFNLRIKEDSKRVDTVLLDASGQVVDEPLYRRGGEVGRINRLLAAGTYYVKVTGNGDFSSYQMSLSKEPGGSLGNAQLMPITATPRIWKDSVSGSDRADVYRFDLTGNNTFSLNLKKLKANADMVLLDSSGKVMQISRRFGKKNEAIGATLEAGTYYAKVMGRGRDTDYQLDMATIPIIPSLPPVKEQRRFSTGDAAKNSGVFTVGSSGEVSFDYLLDGSPFQGELAIFNLKGMDQFEIGSKRYMQEATLRALGNSADSGYVTILDQTEGARFTASAGEPNFNAGEYKGTKTFKMNPGDQFGVMLIPNGTTPDALLKDDFSGDRRPLFSIPAANPEGAIQFVQVDDIAADGNVFAFEDQPLIENSDFDYDDLAFQMKGVIGNSSLLNAVVAPGKDWRTSQIGQQIEQYIFDPLDLAGNSLDDAYRVHPSTEGKTYRGWVGSIDSDDYYTMHLGARHELRLSLDSLSANANVEITDPSGAVVKTSINSPLSEENIDTVLESGVYRIKVTNPTGLGTPFNLNLAITPLIEGTEGLTTTGSEAEFEFDLAESIPLINADEFGRRPNSINQNPRFPGIDGRGYDIVVIDSGIDATHPLFGADSDNNKIRDRIVYQEDFTLGRPNNSATDTDGHGTHVASIAAGDTGVAPGAGIIALKVDAADNTFPGLTSQQRTQRIFAEVEAALQKVLELSNNKRYNIVSVNMSFGNGLYMGVDDFITTTNPQELQEALKDFGISDELSELARRDIIVVSSSGNAFDAKKPQEGVSYPSADPHSLSIGSVLDGGGKSVPPDTIAPSSQRDSTLTSIFAPGEVILAARNGGGTTEKSGTSQAASHVAGMVALAQQIAEPLLGRKLSLNEFRDLLYKSGKPIQDPVTGITTFRRADMLALRNEIISNLLPEVTLKIPDVVISGNYTGRGDQEFDGNGPRIKVQSQAQIQDGELQISGDASFEEWKDGRPKDDFTTFTGGFNTKISINQLIAQQYPQYAGYLLNTNQILSSDGNSLETVDVELHDPQVILQDKNNLVKSYIIVGDTSQSPIFASGGDLPTVSIAFNPVKVRLRAPDGKLVEDSFEIPQITDLGFDHVAGDLEFAGHGPNIQIETEIVADTEKTVLRPQISGVFKETEPDYTEFSSTFKFQGVNIRSQPSAKNKTYPGYVIDTILSDAKDVLNTVDSDLHSEQSISIGQDELVSTYRIMGDSKGDDHPYVALSFNPIRVQLRKPS